MAISVITSATKDHRPELIRRVRGQTIEVPDLLLIYAGWIVQKHDTTDQLRHNLEEWLKTYVPTEKERTKQRKVDSAFCAGHFFGRVPTDRFKILGSLVAWFFFWDDEVDCGSLTEDREKAEAYCDDAMTFIRSCLQPNMYNEPPAPGRLHNSGPFVEIGRAMQTGQSMEDRDRFARSLYDVEDYIEGRLVSVACEPCLTIMAWAYELSLPSWIWKHEATLRLFREVSMGSFLCNDIASLKKEIDDNEIDSLVPILIYHEGLTAQEAIDRVSNMAVLSWQDLLDAEQRLRIAVGGETERVQRDVELLIRGCKDILVGGLIFTFHAPRYLPKTAFDRDGRKFKVVL
ncbi:terpenoid synthase [Dothidotthia symphoricarpi CBS 119687]|uniref:Terpene synthase n=1 Tax=Dothidotthia symphoricarpi CBS 119687 TaxID=1392245 RepID=A0A6A6A3U6_9PLEO|nr:terpenoid synthase [Dothidotthia symphoricarpi CBS 119687]KAF2125587.1 terpenoid synthase [Dothidotthia symphoricarpi CBS 119687]